MAHELFRIKEKLLNTPHLAHPQTLESVLKYLDSRNSEGFEAHKFMAKVDGDSDSNSRYSYNRDVKVAVMSIDGPLTYKPISFMGMECGGASYQQLKEDFTYLVKQGAETIAFMADSGGGEAFQMMPTASYMRSLATQHGVRIISYVDGMACSACYGLIAISDEIIMAPSSKVGSIGVVVRLMNDSKALEMEGYERTYVFAGESKTPFDTDGSFRKEFLEDIQSKVDALYKDFTGFVAEHRNISVDAVRATQAKTFLPDMALDLGLADKVMTLEEFYTHLADTAQGGKSMLKSNLFKMIHTETDEVQMKQLEELQAQHSELEAKFNAQEAELVAQLGIVTSLSAELVKAKEDVAAAVEEKNKLETAAVETKMNARKEAIAAVEADVERAGKLFTSLESVDAAAFEAVIASLAAKEDKLETSELFTQRSKPVEDESVEVPSFAKYLPKKK